MHRLPWLTLLLSVAAEVAWWQEHGNVQDRLLLVVGILGTFTVAAHAVLERSLLWAMGFGIGAVVPWFLAQLLNVHAGLPYGDARLSDRLAPFLLGVPVPLLLVWVPVAYVAFLAARRCVKATLLVAVLGALYLAAADAVGQAALVHFGYITWHNAHPALPGAPGVPAQAFVGTLLVSVVTLLLVDVLNSPTARDGLPRTLFAWRYLADVAAAAVVLHSSTLALVAAVVAGVVAAPYAYLTLVDRV